MAKSDPNPSDKGLDVLRFIIAHIEKHGFQPSQSEIAASFGVTKNAINNRLRELARRGFVETNGDGEKVRERAIRLVHVKFKAYFVEV